MRRFDPPLLWRLILLCFVLESLWIALSAIFPMAFDEDFHLGLIKFYSHHSWPFLTDQPAGAEMYGAVGRDPSYLYHYLMSFPYQLLSWLTSNQQLQIIGLRLINIGLGVWSLVLFRRLLLRVGVSGQMINAIAAFFILIPIVPLLVGQINYDNLLMVCVAGVCLLTEAILRHLQAKSFPLVQILQLVSLCLLASLVKFAFLPIFLVVVGFVALAIWRYGRGQEWKWMTRSWHAVARWQLAGLIMLVVVSSGLFAQRYGVNVISYKTPVPDCATVLDTDTCLQYGPWNRDYYLVQTKGATDTNSFTFLENWLYGMWYRLFFAVNGNVEGAARYQTFPPLPIVSITGAIVILGGLFASAIALARLRRWRPMYIFFVLIAVSYVAILWLQNYQMYIRTGQIVAVNGRYLLVVAWPLAAVMGAGVSVWLRPLPQLAKRVGIAAVILLMLQGGGVISFVMRSNQQWYWQHSVVQEVNQTMQNVLRPVINGSTETQEWRGSP